MVKIEKTPPTVEAAIGGGIGLFGCVIFDEVL
jgi:hypothetical protein